MGDFELHAPQWVDFTEIYGPMQDFFEKEHIVQEQDDSFEYLRYVTYAKTKAQADLDIIKNTPIKVISPKNRNNKEVIGETTYDQVLSDAMRKLELCKKPPKIQEAMNKTTNELNALKAPNKSKIVKSSRSVGCRSVTNRPTFVIWYQHRRSLIQKRRVSTKYVPSGQDSLRKSTKVKKSICTQIYDTSTSTKEMSVSHALLEQDENHTEDDTSKRPNDLVNDTQGKKEKQNEEDDEECNEKINEEPKENNEKFNETDDKECNENDKKLQELKIKNKPEELTDNEEAKEEDSQDDVDAAIGKDIRTPPLNRPTIVTWHQHKRSLIPKRRVSTNKKYISLAEAVSRFQTKTKPNQTAAVPNSTQSNEKACATNVHKSKIPQPHRDKVSSGPKNMVTKVTMTDPSGIIVEREKITFFGVPKDTGVVRNATRIMPFSFEARNKDLQMKKEQRLKCLQEANKTKTEFHARPVPNFSKPPTPTGKQQQQNTKKSILPCPFGFDDRDRKVFERKERLVKQMLEEDKRARVFRANPVPTFKPVMVRGRSKEHLLAREKSTVSEQAEDQENKEPNVESKVKKEHIPKSKNSVCTVDKAQKAPLKAYPPKLNTDKRARERHEFDEKMRRKEMEEEAKRQEAEKKRLESEKEMTAKLRKQTEVKARPMPAYKAPIIVKATKQLTDPQSPAFASKLRSKQK